MLLSHCVVAEDQEQSWCVKEWSQTELPTCHWGLWVSSVYKASHDITWDMRLHSKGFILSQNHIEPLVLPYVLPWIHWAILYHMSVTFLVVLQWSNLCYLKLILIYSRISFTVLLWHGSVIHNGVAQSCKQTITICPILSYLVWHIKYYCINNVHGATVSACYQCDNCTLIY